MDSNKNQVVINILNHENGQIDRKPMETLDPLTIITPEVTNKTTIAIITETTDLTCPICLEPMHDKLFITLKCNHTFCYNCLKDCIKTNHRKCGLCKRKFDSKSLELFRPKFKRDDYVANSAEQEEILILLTSTENDDVQNNNGKCCQTVRNNPRYCYIPVIILLIIAILITVLVPSGPR